MKRAWFSLLSLCPPICLHPSPTQRWDSQICSWGCCLHNSRIQLVRLIQWRRHLSLRRRDKLWLYMLSLHFLWVEVNFFIVINRWFFDIFTSHLNIGTVRNWICSVWEFFKRKLLLFTTEKHASCSCNLLFFYNLQDFLITWNLVLPMVAWLKPSPKNMIIFLAFFVFLVNFRWFSTKSLPCWSQYSLVFSASLIAFALTLFGDGCEAGCWCALDSDLNCSVETEKLF